MATKGSKKDSTKRSAKGSTKGSAKGSTRSSAKDSTQESTQDATKITVPVKRHDVTLTFDDILTPMTQTAKNLLVAGRTDESLKEALDPAISQDLQVFTDLVTQLSTVVKRINQRAPNLLASKPGPPPIDTGRTTGPVVIVAPPSTLPPGKINTPYKETFFAEGGKRPYRYQAADPKALPPGLTLSEKGVLSGTATKAGKFTFKITATDSAGATSPTQSFTLVIA